VVSLAGFADIIAGSVEFAFLVQTGEASIGDFELFFFQPFWAMSLGEWPWSPH